MKAQTSLSSTVRAELRKMTLIWYTSAFLLLLFASGNILFGDNGYLKLRELEHKRTALSNEVEAVKLDNDRLRSSIKSMKENDFFLEKQAREELGYSKSDEYIILYDR